MVTSPATPSLIKEWKLVSVRDFLAPEDMDLLDTPGRAAEYWHRWIASPPTFRPEVEHLAVVILNTKLRAKGHQVVSVGTLNEAPGTPREIFRTAIVANAHAVVVMHNHPSGEPEPSEADRRATRKFREAGELVGISLLDHVIIGHQRHFSFRDVGLL